MKYTVHGYEIQVESRDAFVFAGYTEFVKLDGKSIRLFMDTLHKGGSLLELMQFSLSEPQVWVCLSGNEGHADADCRCTVGVICHEEQTGALAGNSRIYTLHAPKSEWAVFRVGEQQSPADLHQHNVYKMVEEIGYKFNFRVGFHLDNEHEWAPGKTMKFLLPVIRS